MYPLPSDWIATKRHEADVARSHSVSMGWRRGHEAQVHVRLVTTTDNLHVGFEYMDAFHKDGAKWIRR